MTNSTLSDQQKLFINAFITKLKDNPVTAMCSEMQSVVKSDLARLGKGDPETASLVQSRLDAAATLQADGQDEEALRQLALAAEDIADMTRAARDAGMRDEVMTGKVSFEALIVQWNARRAELKGQLDQLAKAIKADDDEDPGFDVPGKLGLILDRFDERLVTALDAMRNAQDADALKRQAQDALSVTTEYLGTLASDQLIGFVADNPFDVDADARAILGEPLHEIASRLRGFAA